jgi:hypothetical protein
MYIWKYTISKITDEFTIEMPRNSRVLCIQVQRGVPCIWVKTDGDKENMEKRTFVIIGTGNPFDAEGLIYVGTWQEDYGYLVWHLFYRW